MCLALLLCLVFVVAVVDNMFTLQGALLNAQDNVQYCISMNKINVLLVESISFLYLVFCSSGSRTWQIHCLVLI